MNIKILSTVFITILFCTCTEQHPQKVQKSIIDSSKQLLYFPVTEYIRGQLSEIDSMPITPLKIIIQKDKQDSIWMKKADIRVFAEPFLHTEIDSAYLAEFYDQSSFVDQSINSITLTYEPKNNDAEFKVITIYIDPKNNKVTRIFTIKEFRGSIVHQTIQLNWRSDKWCKITSIWEQNGIAPVIKEEIMKWDFNE